MPKSPRHQPVWSKMDEGTDARVEHPSRFGAIKQPQVAAISSEVEIRVH
ncbi:MAG: hypothetical protein ACYSOG_05050 [Planctomycetota bacterium]|jgi:hypothetical protein